MSTPAWFKQPMLASPAIVEKLKYPLFASVKLDGIRATVFDRTLWSRKLKRIPSLWANQTFGDLPDGFDGELIAGAPFGDGVFNRSTSAAMSSDGAGMGFYVFDRATGMSYGYDVRRPSAMKISGKLWDGKEPPYVEVCDNLYYVTQYEIHSREELDEMETMALENGYEGLILRQNFGPYLTKRSTFNEGRLLKLKRRSDSEAIILGIEEEMHNGNVATTDERGYTKRTSHKANKTGKRRMGKLHVRDIHSGVEFHVGTGFVDELRASAWNRQEEWLGKIIKYEFFPVGVKDKPRHPVFIGFRSEIDI